MIITARLDNGVIQRNGEYTLTLRGDELIHIVMLSYMKEGGEEFPNQAGRVVTKIQNALGVDAFVWNEWLADMADTWDWAQ